MKLVSHQFKKGFAKVFVETSDDLWTLSQVLDVGDIARGKTTRKIKMGSSESKGTVTKKTMTLSVRVTKADWVASSSVLRVTGSVVDGPEDVPRGSSHTIDVEPHSELVIEKETWPSYQIKRLEEASAGSKKKILVCVFDRETAHFALLKTYGYELLSTMHGVVQKKRVETPVVKNFFKEIGTQLESYDARYELHHIILASPAFWKEELLKAWSNNGLKKKLILATCSSAEENAIEEVLRRPETKLALESERVAQETELVERIFERIAKEGAVTYGLAHVRSACDAGACSLVAVTDTLITKNKEAGTGHAIEDLLRRVDAAKGDVRIVSGSHNAGERLDGLGGIAALLRYKMNP